MPPNKIVTDSNFSTIFEKMRTRSNKNSNKNSRFKAGDLVIYDRGSYPCVGEVVSVDGAMLVIKPDNSDSTFRIAASFAYPVD
jgi:NADPH:quinone reductase-like Zn-dependent oxidoreductase